MEDIYSLNPLLSCPEDVVRVGNSSVSATTAVAAAATTTTTTSGLQLLAGPVASNYLQLEAPKQDVTGSDMPDRLIKTQIANHPLYPDLVSAYIECQKVGAPPELVSLLEEIGQECHPMNARREIGDGPELDDFMFGGKVERLKEKDDILVTVTSTRRQESYCEVLHRYKEELSRPFNEATLFLGNIQSQLSNLCKGILTKSLDNNRSVLSDKAPGTSEEDISCGEIEAVKGHESSGTRLADQTLKEMLLRKYSGHFNSLRQEFLKKKKNGKLPKDARMALMHWWNTHHRWPYPTEEEKVKLSSITGLDQKQINNWFINQRKRHWKPSDQDTRFAVMEGVSGRAIEGPLFF